MKRVLSLVLAVLTVLALIPAAVTAESFDPGFRNDTVDATGNAANPKAYHIDSKYFAMSYTFTLLTAQPYAAGDNGCVGISLGANEDGVAYIPHEYSNGDGTCWPWINCVVGINETGEVATGEHELLVFGPWWAGHNEFCTPNNRSYFPLAPYLNQKINIIVAGEYYGGAGENGAPGKLVVSVYINGEKIKAWGSTRDFVVENFDGWLGWKTALTGCAATVEYAEADTLYNDEQLAQLLYGRARANGAGAFATGRTDNKVGAINGEWTVSNDGKTYTSVTGDLGGGKGSYYQLGDAGQAFNANQNYTLSATVSTAKGQAGFLFNVTDSNANGTIEEGWNFSNIGDNYYLIDLDPAFQGYGIEDNIGYGWNGWNWSGGDLYTAGDDVNLKLVVKNNVAKIYINGQLVHTTHTRHNGDGFGLWSKGEGTQFKNVKVSYEINAPETFEDFPELNQDVTGFYQVRENVNGTRDVRISALGVDELLTKYDTCKFVISYTENGVEKTQDVVYNSTKVFKYLDDESSYISFAAPDGWHMLVLVITGVPESVTGFTVKELVLEGAGMDPYTYTDLGSGII